MNLLKQNKIFSEIIKNKEKRENLADSCYDIFAKYNDIFDGIDKHILLSHLSFEIYPINYIL